MEELVNKLIGKRVDISCGTTAVVRGTIEDIKNGVLRLKDDDMREAYVAVDKIATVCECSDSPTRPGFVAS
ncbi:MAG: hypothetical protein LC730_01555 [Acidobacteria bacterium]|nr:hypothetical protein [Acidobacteriota bacterium]MCA1608130.1 hypothetical protein [Acidobacteriota bacterium]